MFQRNGRAGYVLQPEVLRKTDDPRKSDKEHLHHHTHRYLEVTVRLRFPGASYPLMCEPWAALDNAGHLSSAVAPPKGRDGARDHGQARRSVRRGVDPHARLEPPRQLGVLSLPSLPVFVVKLLIGQFVVDPRARAPVGDDDADERGQEQRVQPGVARDPAVAI